MNSDQTVPVAEDSSPRLERLRRARHLRWIVAGNPFYPLSAVLVLLGVFLLSGDDRLFASETGQLHFNFGALEAYGFLVAATAVFLFRRVIHYDTLMLVVLAGLPILVPFILISQGAHLGRGTMTVLCVMAGLLGVGQFALIRRGVCGLPFSSGLPWWLGAVLIVNLALPIALKGVHARFDAIEWAVQQDRHWHLGWTLLLPALVLGIFALPRQRDVRFGDCRAGWLTVVFAGLLVAGTWAHLASLGYVYSFPWRNDFAHPAGWLFAWLLWWRRNEWSAGFDARISSAAIALPGMACVMAALQSGSDTLLWLNAFNLALSCGLVIAGVDRRSAVALGLASVAGVLLSLPLDAIQRVVAVSGRLDALLVVFSLLAFGASWRFHNPAGTVVAALAIIAPLRHLWLDGPGDTLLIGQFALVVWWLHSLTWPRSVPFFARVLQFVVFGGWVLHTLFWWAQNEGAGRLPMAVFALTMVLAAGWLAWRQRRWTFGVLATAAGCVAALPGMNDAASVTREVPAGAWLLLAGVFCFAAGTAAALVRKRWQTGRGERT